MGPIRSSASEPSYESIKIRFMVSQYQDVLSNAWIKPQHRIRATADLFLPTASVTKSETDPMD